MISPDLPITKSSENKLNRESFAESLANVILQSTFPTSFTVGLYGAWGSGKTSLLNMVIEQVERRNTDVVILRFNPWLCSDPKQLITQFFKQLASAIKIKKPTADSVCELVDQYADLFDAASLIPYAGAAIVAAGKMFTTKARNRMKRKSNDMQGQKDEIIRTMVKENLKIIVSIDDIDRLSEEEIIAVFQLVKALADFPNAVYCLLLIMMLWCVHLLRYNTEMGGNTLKKLYKFHLRYLHQAWQVFMMLFSQNLTGYLEIYRIAGGTKQHGQNYSSME